MKMAEVIQFLDGIADPALQESYDNCGLLTGQKNWECKGILCTLDATEEVIKDAIDKSCNLVVAHHPIIFKGLKKINGKNYVERTIINAIKNDVAIYAVHTSLDNMINGVSGKMAALLDLKNISVLSPKENSLRKLFSFVPVEHAEKLRTAIFEAGGGHIGNYSECSFSALGKGTFKAGEGTNPFVGKQGQRHEEDEVRVEMIYPHWLEQKILEAMKKNHPYEEVAYDIISLDNEYSSVGSGVIGDMEKPMDEKAFLEKIKTIFKIPAIRHAELTGHPIKRVALCGGAGSFLITKALMKGADAYVTADIKYHEFFDAEKRMLLCDIGHYESEQFTIDLLHEKMARKFPTFAVLKTGVNTNPVRYF
jgi:dinuclear metal center YbgI/SA1388 family protein